MLDTRPTSPSPDSEGFLDDGAAAYTEMVKNFAEMAALFAAKNFDSLAVRTRELEENLASKGFAGVFALLLPPTIVHIIKMAESLSLGGVRQALSSYKEGRITEAEFRTSLTALTHSPTRNGKES